MAIKLSNGELADRPLLTEDEHKLILIALTEYNVKSGKEAILRENTIGKLYRSKTRINKLKYNQ